MENIIDAVLLVKPKTILFNVLKKMSSNLSRLYDII